MNIPASHAATPCPLLGVRVLDMTTVLAGPYATYQLALLGAEVIKVERPDGGDWARKGAPVVGAPEWSAQFVAQNGSKQSVVLDLGSEAGRDALLRLAATCDVVVENFSPGVADRLGVGFEALRRVRPDLVYCAISGYGQDGPMSRRPAYDHVVQAASGITMLTGTAETVPNRIGPPMIDYLAGIYGAFSVLAALRERDRTGQAQVLDVAMLDTALVAMAATVSGYLNGGVAPVARGNTAASGSPMSGIFPTQDGLLSMTANQDAQFERAMHALGLQAHLYDPRFADAASRLQHVQDLQALLIARLADAPAAHWETVLSAAHVPAARVRTVADIVQDEHVRARGVHHDVHDPVSGATLHLPGLGFKWNGHMPGPTTAPPRLGEHTEQVLERLMCPAT